MYFIYQLLYIPDPICLFACIRRAWHHYNRFKMFVRFFTKNKITILSKYIIFFVLARFMFSNKSGGKFATKVTRTVITTLHCDNFTKLKHFHIIFITRQNELLPFLWHIICYCSLSYILIIIMQNLRYFPKK